MKEKNVVYEGYIGKGIATLASAIVCGYWAYLNGGTSGIGWFIVSLLFIW